MRIKLIGKLLPVLMVLASSSATAIDTREVIIGKQKSLVTVPPHLGQVLATPNRNYGESLPNRLLQGTYKWEVYAAPIESVQWRDLSYLKGKDVIRVEKAYFDFDKAHPIDVAALEIVLSQYPTQEGYTFLVVGHADEAGSYAYNQRLSEQRAKSIKDILVSRGYEQESISTLGKGKTIPVSFKNQSMNRRAEIVIKAPEYVLRAKQSIKPRSAYPAKAATPAQQQNVSCPGAQCIEMGGGAQNQVQIQTPSANGGAQLLPSNQPRQPVMRGRPESEPTATQKTLLPSLGGGSANDLHGLFKRSPDPNN